ncbi:MAG TPA: AIR synthase-related protein, partial [Tepidisphaeraceae bacterium]|nr:AIR synthase-related protein [Tepidisphaeraceae bacterium]
ANTIATGAVAACHDASDGGIGVAAAEMCIAAGCDLAVSPQLLNESAFAETPGRYLIEFRDSAAAGPPPDGVRMTWLTTGTDRIDASEMTAAWRGTLDW